jgi:hypothetical protein
MNLNIWYGPLKLNIEQKTTKKIIVKHTQWGAQNVRITEVKQNNET